MTSRFSLSGASMAWRSAFLSSARYFSFWRTTCSACAASNFVFVSASSFASSSCAAVAWVPRTSAVFFSVTAWL
ncbi:hypothetical protein ACFPRL_22700 [Pseudoclavibacter helvolus]